jgi:hypothetical protein
MSYPDLMLTKAAALGRQQQQRRITDPYEESTPSRVYRSREMPAWLRRAQYGVARRLVTWGERLQGYNAPQPAAAATRPAKADCLETIQVRR